MSSGTRLFVGNVPQALTEEELKKIFSSYGEIIDIDIKCKPSDESNRNKFAFITISATNSKVESCIIHFSKRDHNGVQLYVTRARESFLERLERERKEEQEKHAHKENNIQMDKPLVQKVPVIKLGAKLNPGKRKLEQNPPPNSTSTKKTLHRKDNNDNFSEKFNENPDIFVEKINNKSKNKDDSDKKRLESMKLKSQEFKQKQRIIKTGLTSVDSMKNNKIIFTEDHEQPEMINQSPSSIKTKLKNSKTPNKLFDGDDSGDEINFDIKKQFEGKKGQKVLDLQSRYKSDKRFTLDERFIDDGSDKESTNESIETEQIDEKAKQLNILQDVLGISIKSRASETAHNKKTKPGMLRFDPSQPEHAKFLMPVQAKEEPPKKIKRKNLEQNKEEFNQEVLEIDGPKVEVSKEQFYKVSETLKEAIAQPSTFSLRSLFPKNEEPEKDAPNHQTADYIPLEVPKQPKMKNPLDHTDRNPFVYDSSDSEAEDINDQKRTEPSVEQFHIKAVWKENLFFSENDTRLTDGLIFFNKTNEDEVQKERRELKSLMKKRIYNKDRKNQMFQKKIGGRRKTMKKSYNKNKLRPK